MTVFPLLAVSFIMNVVAVLFFLCAVALILVILVQKGKGGGLGGVLGAGMASGILGSKTGDFLTWVTIVLVGIFLTFAVTLSKLYRPSISDFGVGQAQRSPVQQQQPQGSQRPLTPIAPGDANAGPGASSLGK